MSFLTKNSKGHFFLIIPFYELLDSNNYLTLLKGKSFEIDHFNSACFWKQTFSKFIAK